MPPRILRLRLLFLLVLFLALAGPSGAIPLKLDLGAGYSHSSSPAITTRDSADASLDKSVGEDFGGFHITGTLGIPLTRWFGLQASVSGAFESGEAAHPATLWRGTPLLIVPGTYPVDTDRKTYTFLAGVRVQDQESSWRVQPWGYLLAGWGTTSLDLQASNLLNDEIFYPEGEISQAGLALALGLGADMQIFRGLGLRLGAEYQPIFASEESLLSFGEGRTLSGSSYTSLLKADLVGEVIHQWRVMVGPMFSF